MPHNLPLEPNRFIGRERDLTEVAGLLTRHRVVTLCGAGGIGKTRFALQVAARVVDDFADGVWLVELAKITRADLLLHMLADVLQAAEEGARTLLDTLIGRIASQRILLVLDNCEHVIEECARVVDALIANCANLRVLATSREPVRIAGELVWRVPPLDLPDDGAIEASEAVQLFLERAYASGSRLEPTDETMRTVGQLCRALDGMPLALELAAARTRVLSPEQISDRIKDRFKLLTGGERTAPARHRTLLATVQWSHDLLEEGERVLLRRLAVFAAQFDLEYVELVCGDGILPADDILDLLAGLVDKSLVQFDQARYRLLETIAHFAREQLKEAGEEQELRDRHLRVTRDRARDDFWVDMLKKLPGDKRLQAFGKVADRNADHRAALAWAVETGQAEVGLETACYLYPIWAVRGTWIENRAWYERLLSLDTSRVRPELVGEAWSRQADMAFGQDDLATAERSALRGLELMRTKPGYRFALGLTLNNVAIIYLRTGRPEEARRHAEEALEGATQAGDLWNIGMAHNGLTLIAGLGGKLREAQRHAEDALVAFRETDQPWGIGRALISVGVLGRIREDYDNARANLEASLPYLEALDAKPEIARALAELGRVATQQGDLGRARDRLVESIELSRKIGQRRGVTRGLAALARVAEASGEIESAVLLCGTVAALRDAIGQRSSVAWAEEILGKARTEIGESRTGLLYAHGRAMSEEAALQQAQSAEPVERAAPGPGEQVSMEVASLLTEREREVVGLLVKGMSNRRIAEELVISPATVARHVANIMLKLGFSSRTQVAAWALEHRIVNG
ncbi:tetratricopeptide repeat protein [Nonomuraea soli]|uniref:Putative ATPase/DNA-binding CsgD family transcriptional regulator n=1 Tax=Nonomuraea soli TaxID=1032476 RepID=A0A7W0CMQ6_9ACTN|nr:tetratricopeptide repeat protein [Nonomuraea soli]MBA2893956.1 putative ATPase/DNA-binding CsgD family transcriptional regulator [Nonomuraea soli]